MCSKRKGGTRCTCKPTYRAWVWSADDGSKLWRSFPTEAAARTWRHEAASAVVRGTLRAPTSTTIADAAAALLEGMRSERVRTRSGDPYKPSAIRSYDQALSNHVLPVLGGARLGDIRRRDVQRLADELLAAGASPSTIRNALMPLRVIYRRAVADGDVSVNPCTAIRLPAVRSTRERIAAPEEATQLLVALPPDIRAVYAIAFYAGLRAGELRGLRWDDVDLANGVIRVQRSMDDSGAIIEPKSRNGERRVPIVGVLRDILDERKTSTWSHGYVLGTGPERPFTLSNVHRRAKAAWSKHNEALREDRRQELHPIGLHEARHTFASLLIAAGVNAKAVSTFMGHASIQTTYDLYGKLMPGSEAEAATLLDDYLERADTRHRLAAFG
jgi:integrase